MRVPDVNVLLYAVNRDAPHHRVARRWIEDKLSGAEAVGFAWLVLLGFIRVSTNPVAVGSPLSPGDALDRVEEWLAAAPATVVHPTRHHARNLRGLLGGLGSAGNLTGDAHLAALAIEHGATLASFDGDFHRFGGLRFEHLP